MLSKFVRNICDKETCVFCEDGHCLSVDAPKLTTPDEIEVEDSNGWPLLVCNSDELSKCENFIGRV